MNYLDKQDEDLMKSYQEGDFVAFETLYNRHKGKAYGYLLKRLKDAPSSDEVFQNAFVKLHRKRHQFNPDLPFLNCFFIILRSEMLDYLKKQKPEEEFSDELVLQQVVEPPPSLAFALAHVNSLSAREKDFIHFRYFQELSFKELSSKFKTSQVNARKIISRSLKKLRDEFEIVRKL